MIIGPFLDSLARRIEFLIITDLFITKYVNDNWSMCVNDCVSEVALSSVHFLLILLFRYMKIKKL